MIQWSLRPGYCAFQTTPRQCEMNLTTPWSNSHYAIFWGRIPFIFEDHSPFTNYWVWLIFLASGSKWRNLKSVHELRTADLEIPTSFQLGN